MRNAVYEYETFLFPLKEFDDKNNLLYFEVGEFTLRQYAYGSLEVSQFFSVNYQN